MALGVHVEVRLGADMAVPTVRTNGGCASQKVLSMGNRLQMSGVDASAVTTEMIDLKAPGDGFSCP
jgi:hypothetical protein